MTTDAHDKLNLQYTNALTNVDPHAETAHPLATTGLTAADWRRRYYAPSAAGPGPGHSCGAPARVIDFEEWLTLIGTSGTEDVIQAARKWLNAEAMPTCNLQIQVSDISNCTLVLESAAVAEGQWSQVAAYTQAGDVGLVASSEGGYSNYSKFIRWRVEKAGSDWEICFKIRAMPGKATAEATLTPRQAG